MAGFGFAAFRFCTRFTCTRMACEIQTEPQMSAPGTSARVMTCEEFLNWPGDNQHIEWLWQPLLPPLLSVLKEWKLI